MSIHPTASIAKGAQLGNGVSIGPMVSIGQNVEIGDDCSIGQGVSIEGWTKIGPRTQVFAYSVLGTPPQDLKFSGEKTELEIGSDNTIREFVTINRATGHGGGVTHLGNHNFIMAYAHIAHDCSVGNHVILANAATLAGHITVEDHVSIGGLTGVHQFVNIGRYAFIGGCSAVSQDIVPYALAAGNHARILGLNLVGLKRQGFSEEQLTALKKVYRVLFRTHHNRSLALAYIQENCEMTPEVKHVLDFIQNSQRGFAKGITSKE
ncbi:acyl-ACP--UDP-N-acetylglucosamine O-acyltransferase [bacterium]|nr:acyl-ACP--UDP-N-acetylglucosamine O-acyltransferase [bacterium]